MVPLFVWGGHRARSALIALHEVLGAMPDALDSVGTAPQMLWSRIGLELAVPTLQIILLQCLQILHEVAHLVRVEPELGHGRVTGADSLSQWLL